MGGIATTYVNVTTTGSAGSATGSATSRHIDGFLLDLYVNFQSAPATTDTTISFGTPALGNILVLTSTNTDVLHAPRKQLSDAAGAAITGGYDLHPVNGTIKVDLAQCDALTDAVVVTIRYLKVP